MLDLAEFFITPGLWTAVCRKQWQVSKGIKQLEWWPPTSLVISDHVFLLPEFPQNVILLCIAQEGEHTVQEWSTGEISFHGVCASAIRWHLQGRHLFFCVRLKYSLLKQIPGFWSFPCSVMLAEAIDKELCSNEIVLRFRSALMEQLRVGDYGGPDRVNRLLWLATLHFPPVTIRMRCEKSWAILVFPIIFVEGCIALLASAFGSLLNHFTFLKEIESFLNFSTLGSWMNIRIISDGHIKWKWTFFFIYKSMDKFDYLKKLISP